MKRLKKSALVWNHSHCMHQFSQKRMGFKAAITFMRAFKKHTWFAVFIVWHCLMSMWAEMQQICHSLLEWEWNRQYSHANHSPDPVIFISWSIELCCQMTTCLFADFACTWWAGVKIPDYVWGWPGQGIRKSHFSCTDDGKLCSLEMAPMLIDTKEACRWYSAID